MQLTFIIEDMQFYLNSGMRNAYKKKVDIDLTFEQIKLLKMEQGEAVTDLFISISTRKNDEPTRTSN
jgi:hypothetical protein